MHSSHCPNCNISWYQPQTITEFYLSKGHTLEEAMRIASLYGDTPEYPKHFSQHVTGIELRDKYDGISYWHCDNCNTYFNRWTMQPTTNI